jgi:hypothetical protein
MFPLLGIAWAPVLVLLHELGHALAAILLTDGEGGARRAGSRHPRRQGNLRVVADPALA